MKNKALLALLLLFAQAFCPPLQQSLTLAQTAPTSSAVEDSDAFLRSATRSRPARDYTQRVEALLGQMTLEEKVGQMTQLQIGMVTTGNNQTIEIDPAKRSEERRVGKECKSGGTTSD